jgi:hypothetical protein
MPRRGRPRSVTQPTLAARDPPFPSMRPACDPTTLTVRDDVLAGGLAELPVSGGALPAALDQYSIHGRTTNTERRRDGGRRFPAVEHTTCKRSLLVRQRLRPADGVPPRRRASRAADHRSRPNANSMTAVAMAAVTIATPRNPIRCAHRPVETVPTSLTSVRGIRPVRVARSHHRGLPRSGSHL